MPTRLLGKALQTFEGDVPAEFLKGSEHYNKQTVGELLDFVKAKPKEVC